MKWLKALGGLLVITLLFAGCIKVEGEVVIDDDGSGEVNFLTAVDADGIADSMGEEFGDLIGTSQICDEFGNDMNTGDVPTNALDANISEYNEDGFCGARIEYSLASSLDHSSNMSDLFDEQTRLYKEGDNWFFSSPFSADEITGDAEDLGSEFGDIETFFEDASFKLVVDLPGRAIEGENNATEVGNDGRFTWDIDLLNPPAELFAQTEPGSGGGSGGGGGGLLRILGLLLILGLIAFGVMWFLKNRGGSTPDAATSLGGPGVSPVAGSVPDGSGYVAPPLATGPPVMDSPPGSHPADATKETVVMSAEEAQRLAAEARGSAPMPGGSVGGAIGGAAGAAGGAIAGAAGGLGNMASDAVGGATGAASDAVGGATGAASDAVSGATGAASDAVAGATGAAAAASPDPTWDEALGAWVLDHPTRGRLSHDPASDSWNPI